MTSALLRSLLATLLCAPVAMAAAQATAPTGLQVDSIEFFEGDETEGSSYSARFTDETEAQIAKAAQLKKDAGGRYFAKLKGNRHLEAGEAQKGTRTLTCVFSS